MNQIKTRILVVEDNLQDFLIIREVLGQIKDFFVQIDYAEDLQSALKSIEEDEFDIIFLDLFLPDGFGEETFYKVRAIATAPIVILSGLADKDTALKIVKQGAQDYLMKGDVDVNLIEKTIIYSIERKKYQEELERSERRNRTIFESVGIAIAEYDYTELRQYVMLAREEGKNLADLFPESVDEVLELRNKLKVLDLNPEALSLYGCASFEEFISSYRQLYTQDSVRYFRAIIKAIWESHEELVFELPFYNIEGHLIHTLKRWRFLGSDAGFYRLLISTEDVTEIKKNEERVFRQSVLMESVAKATRTLMASGDIREQVNQSLALVGPALNADKLGVFLFTDKENEKWYHLAGFWDAADQAYRGELSALASQEGVNEVIAAIRSGQPIELFRQGAEGIVAMLMDRHEVQHTIVAPMMADLEVKGVVILGYDQKTDTEEYIFSGLMNLAGNIGSAISTFEARKELENLNEELEQRVDDRTFKMKQAIRELESFSYSVSHDLRAPLRAISGFSSVLASEYVNKLDDQGQHYLNVITRGASEMSQLIQDLLDFSRMGRKRISFEETDINALVDEVIAELSGMAPDREIVWKKEELLACKGDHSMLRQVFINFIWNAVKFTANEEQAVISIRSTAKTPYVEYVVEDNGVGFDMTYVDKVFGVFQRLHNNEEFEGTGVGLAIVQRIVNRHGGRIEAYGEEGKGARFTFTLPDPTAELEEMIINEEDPAFKL